MRLLALYSFFLLNSLAFGQNKICTLSELFSNYASGESALIVVTDTNGISVTYDIPHISSDLIAHDRAFNEILNRLIATKFELVSPVPITWSDFIGMKPITARTWFLRKLD